MNQLKKIALIITLLFASAAAFALPAAPTECPSVASIKAAGFGLPPIATHSSDTYGAVNISYFSTPYRWAFLVSNINASSNEEAKTKSLDLIQTISGAPAPINGGDEGERICFYGISGNHLAVAVTPIPDNF